MSDTHEERFQEILADIPVLTIDSLDTLNRKVPTWIDHLMGNVPFKRVEMGIRPNKRGRPQIHNLPLLPDGIRVKRIDNTIPLCNNLSRGMTQRLIKRYRSIESSELAATPTDIIRRLATAYKLPYEIIQKALVDII